MNTRLGIATAAALLAAAAWAGESLPARPPARLSETGLYASPGTVVVDARNLRYAPQYPLWSDGAVKSRWIYLPEGTTIDVADPASWVFPVGTKLWKEFAFAGRKVETRMLWRASAEEWVYATYVWNDEQTDAELAPDAGIRGLVEIAPGKRHSIPGVADCKNCHESGPERVLGFNALQLSDDRDPLAVHGEPLKPGMATLSSLAAERRFDPPRPEFVLHPPRIPAGSPRERAVLGYFAGNCGHCHNALGPLARVGLVLAHDATKTPEPTITTAVDVRGRFEVPGTPAGTSRRLAPGAPDVSAIVYRMKSRRPASQMPPLGTEIVDEEAVRLIERWIAEDLTSMRAAGK